MDATMMIRGHSDWRYLVILVAVLALLKFLIGMFTGGRWGKLDQILGSAVPIVFDIQLWVMEKRWTGGSALHSWEHPVTMILAIAVAHIAWSRTKKTSLDSAKFRTAFSGFLIASLLMGLGVARITGFM